MKPGTILIDFNGDKIKSTPYQCWPPRGNNLVKLIEESFSWINKKSAIKPFKAIFDINDWGEDKYSIASNKYSEKTIPCFSFLNWPQGNINDYTEVCEKISHKGNFPYKFNKLFWIGVFSHPTRKKFFDTYKSHPKISVNECNIMWGSMHKDNPVHNRAEIMKTNYVSLPDHCDYKYLIDLQGQGYSARAKFLLHSRRPLFYQARKFHEYWYWSMKPFVHFIPIKEDLSDFDAVFAWAESHPKECNQIAENAYQFAKNNLKREDALTRLKHILYKLGTGEFK